MKIKKLVAIGLSALMVTASAAPQTAFAETLEEVTEVSETPEAVTAAETETSETETAGTETEEVETETSETEESETDETETSGTEELEVDEIETSGTETEVQKDTETETTEVATETEIDETEDTEIVTYGAGGLSVNVVSDYGADGTDKKTDTTAFQNALNAVRDAGGGTVTVPNGKYYIDKSLVIYSDTTLSLSNGAEIIRTVYDVPMIRDYSGSQSEVLSGQGYGYAKNIIITGGTWNGNVSGTSFATKEDIMRIYCATNVRISDCTIKGVCGDHHLDFASVDKINVSNVKFSGFVKLSTVDYSSLEKGDENQNELNSDTLSSITSEAVQFDMFEGKGCKNVTVSGCTFDGVLSGVGNHHEKGNTSNIKILNNTFKNVENTCVNLYSFTTTEVSGNTATNVRSFARVYGGSGCTIDNNTISTYTDTAKSKFNMFRVSDKAVLTISNNTINGAGLAGIKLDGSSNANITGNKISKTTHNAITVNESTAVISNNTIANAGNIGIYYSKGKGNANNNTITEAALRGIGVQNKSQVTAISGNVITKGKEQGIYVSENSKVDSITKNTVKNSGTDAISILNATVTTVGGSTENKNTINTPGASGIYASGSVITEISLNEISDAAKTSGAAAVRLNNITSSVKVADNKLTASKQYGVYTTSAIADITGNVIDASALTGIYIKGGSGLKVTGNNITGNKGGSGIYLVENASVTEINGNTITNSKENGIYVKDSTAKTVSENAITSPGTRGISFSAGKATTVSKNTITKPKQDGIYVVEKSKVTTIGGTKNEKNTITTAGVNGIAVKSAVVTTVSGNEITGSKSANIRVESVTDAVTISQNTLTSASKQGISVNGGKIKINSNTVKKSGTYGIYIEGSKTNGSVTKNTVDKVTRGNGIRVCDGKISLTGNTIKNIKSQGIYVLKGTVTLKENKVSGTKDKGFKAAGGKVYFVDGNAKMLLSGKNLTVEGAADKKAKSIKIPEKVTVGNVSFNVTSIKDGAFKGNSKITEVTAGSKLKKIGKNAFYNCKSLKKITLKTTKLTSSNVGAKAFAKINAKCTIKVPKNKVSAYKKIFKSKGASAKVKVAKI